MRPPNRDPMQVLEPETIEEALARLAEDDSAKVVAGGTSLALLLRQGLLSPERLIALHRLSMSSISGESDAMVIGALATHAQIARSALIQSQYPALGLAFRSVATPRIRNMGTIGGNLVQADPHLDPPVALLALDASVTVRSEASDRTIALDDFIIDYFETDLRSTEILTTVRAPVRAANSGLSFIKHLARSKEDYAAVDVGVWIALNADATIREARVAVGGAGPTAFRSATAEGRLRGEGSRSQAAIEAGEAAAEDADPDSDTRGSAGYKRDLIRVLVPRAVELAVADAARPLMREQAPAGGKR